VEQAVAYSTLAVTVGLAVLRPRVGARGVQVTPGIAAVFGVLVLLATGLLEPVDLWTSARIQWRPLLTLTCIMLMTGVVKEVGAFTRLAARIEAQARTASTSRAFNLVFLVSVLTPSLLNNDAAILLLTPVVVALVRRTYPGNPRVLEAFVFAVFLAPGVAPLIISNPMNMIVAEFAGLHFNSYAAVMAPISAVGAVVTFAVLRWHYRDVLATCAPVRVVREAPARHPAERGALAFLLLVFCSYPVVAALDGPIWPIAVLGAAGSLAIARA
jgi:arsenical pump membrane protein